MTAEHLAALHRLIGTQDDPQCGWRGHKGTNALYACEFCDALHEDCTLIEHTANCPVPTAREALAALRRSASPRAEVVPSDATVISHEHVERVRIEFDDDKRVEVYRAMGDAGWRTVGSTGPANLDYSRQFANYERPSDAAPQQAPARTAADAPAGVVEDDLQALHDTLYLAQRSGFDVTDARLALSRLLDFALAALATIPDAPAAPAWKPALDIDGDPITLQRMVGWLDAKYRRHHEEEDKAAADFIRSFTAAPAAPSASEGVLGEPVAVVIVHKNDAAEFYFTERGVDMPLPVGEHYLYATPAGEPVAQKGGAA